MPKNREDDDVSSSMPSNVGTSQKMMKNDEISNGDSNSNNEIICIDLDSSDDEQPAADQTIENNLETNESACMTTAVASGSVNDDGAKKVRGRKRSKKYREDFSCGNFVRPTFIPPVFLTIFWGEHGGDLFSL